MDLRNRSSKAAWKEHAEQVAWTSVRCLHNCMASSTLPVSGACQDVQFWGLAVRVLEKIESRVPISPSTSAARHLNRMIRVIPCR